jgi:hypothetical protein
MNRNKTGGRSKGTPNRVTGSVREVIQAIVEGEAVHLPELLEQLKPNERVTAFIRLTQLVTPPVRPEPTDPFVEQPLFND